MNCEEGLNEKLFRSGWPESMLWGDGGNACCLLMEKIYPKCDWEDFVGWVINCRRGQQGGGGLLFFVLDYTCKVTSFVYLP